MILTYQKRENMICFSYTFDQDIYGPYISGKGKLRYVKTQNIESKPIFYKVRHLLKYGPYISRKTKYDLFKSQNMESENNY